MKGFITPIFPELVVKYKDLDIDIDELNLLYDKQKWIQSNKEDGSYFLNVTQNTNVLDENIHLKNKFVDVLNEFGKNVMHYTNEFYMTTSWFTKTEKNQISIFHNHKNSMFSAVYYFGQPDGELSYLKFQKPYETDFEIIPEKYNDYNGTDYEFAFSNDTLIVFPSYLKHKVMINKYDTDRKSLAMNFIVKGEIGNRVNRINITHD